MITYLKLKMDKFTDWCLKNKTILILGIALAAFFDSIILAILITSIIAWYIKYYNRNRTGE